MAAAPAPRLDLGGFVVSVQLGFLERARRPGRLLLEASRTLSLELVDVAVGARNDVRHGVGVLWASADPPRPAHFLGSRVRVRLGFTLALERVAVRREGLCELVQLSSAERRRSSSASRAARPKSSIAQTRSAATNAGGPACPLRPSRPGRRTWSAARESGTGCPSGETAASSW